MPPSRELVWQQVHWPQPLATDHAVAVLRRLAADHQRGPVFFEVRAERGKVEHLVGTPAHQVRAISQLLEALVPGLLLSSITDARPSLAGAVRLARGRAGLPLATDHPDAVARAVLAALVAARHTDEVMVLQLVLGPGQGPSHLGKVPDPTQGITDRLLSGVRMASPELSSRLREHVKEPSVSISLRAAALAQSDRRRHELLAGLLAALRTTEAAGARLDFTKAPSTFDSLPRGRGLLLSVSEVLPLLGWPLEHLELPGMPNAHPRQLPLRGPDFKTDRLFGQTSAPGKVRPVGVAVEDGLFQTVVVGPTGSGKSTLLQALIRADQTAGRSVVIIDPKQDLAMDVLATTPEHRHDDVVVLDPTDPSPVGLNPLQGTAPPELIADGLLNIIRDLYPSLLLGPRVADVLYATLLSLAHVPGATLAWLPRMLGDARFRREILPSFDSQPELADFWESFSSMSERQQIQHVGPVLSRLRQFLLRPGLRRTLDQSEPRFQLAQVFTRPTILIVPLNEGLLGKDAARLLGSILVTSLWQLSLARVSLPKQDRAPVSIYIDEAQEFLRLGGGDGLADALARSRSLGVAWHLAHQYRQQMPKDVLAAIDANARNRVFFSPSIDDARAMAAMAPELTPEDFLALEPHHVYANLMRAGRPTGWFSARTHPPPEKTVDAATLIARSRARYGRREPADLPPPGERSADWTEQPIGRRRRQA